MLLMFGVGLHFSLGDLMAVRTHRGARRGRADGAWPPRWARRSRCGGAGPLAARLVFGIALSVASTVVLLRALEARGALESHNGRIAVGWLVVEDLAMVLVLVLLPALVGVAGRRGGRRVAAARSVASAGADRCWRWRRSSR